MNHEDLLEEAPKWEKKADVRIDPIIMNEDEPCFCVRCGDECYPNVLCNLHRKSFKHLPEYIKKEAWNQWHKRILARTKMYRNLYQCQKCKQYFHENEVCGHHVKTKGAAPQLKFNILNGIVVCKKCHNYIHSSSQFL